MTRLRLYLDTSVLGAVCDPGPEARLVATHRLLEGIKRGAWAGHISVLVLEEIERAPEAVREPIRRVLRHSSLEVLEESSESLALAQTYVSAGVVAPRDADDARHIAIATVNDIRVVVSWNFRHMVNVEQKQKINSVNVRLGFSLIDLVSPWEVRHEET